MTACNDGDAAAATVASKPIAASAAAIVAGSGCPTVNADSQAPWVLVLREGQAVKPVDRDNRPIKLK